MIDVVALNLHEQMKLTNGIEVKRDNQELVDAKAMMENAPKVVVEEIVVSLVL
jgi:hypothetical protein